MALSHRTDTLNRLRSTGHTESHRQTASNGVVTCFVTQPDNVVLHIDIDRKSDGQDLLNKICMLLGILNEADYFGIQYALTGGDLVWLNMRNRLSKQIPFNPPYNLFFKAKYFVPPYNLLQEETKHQFYLNAVEQLKLGLWDAETSIDLQSHLIAIMAYVQFGAFNPSTSPCKYACFWPDQRDEIPHEVSTLTASYHSQLEGMSVATAKYELLKLAHEAIPAFGVYFYEILDMYGRHLLMGVGPKYVAICHTDMNFIDRFPFDQLRTVTIAGRVITLNLNEDDGSVKMRNFEASSKQAADSLYRSITELHCFFRCDNVRDDVLTRTNPSMHPATIFNNCRSREYTFDVRYTLREVQDRARRLLYHTASEVSSSLSAPTMPVGALGSPPEPDITVSRPSHPPDQIHLDQSLHSSEVQEQVKKCRREEIKCRVCLDRPVKCVFVPCGHFSCEECGLRLTLCPICRKAIDIRQTCYFPWDTPYDDVLDASRVLHHHHGVSHHAPPVMFSLSVSDPNVSEETNKEAESSLRLPSGIKPSSSSPGLIRTPNPTKSLRSAAYDNLKGGNAKDDECGYDYIVDQPGEFNFFHHRRYACDSSTTSSSAVARVATQESSSEERMVAAVATTSIT